MTTTAKPARKRAATSAWTAAKRHKFLTRLAETANVAEACRAAKVSRTLAYSQRKRVPTFAAAWDDAMRAALDDLEAALVERARDGVERPHFFGGAQVGTVRHYSDALAMFILRARRPDVYGKTAEAGEGTLASPTGDIRALIAARVARLKQADS